MLVAVVDVSRPSLIGGFYFLPAQLCDEPVTRTLQLRFVWSVVQAARGISPGPATTADRDSAVGLWQMMLVEL
jgi:hypothetical protein